MHGIQVHVSKSGITTRKLFVDGEAVTNHGIRMKNPQEIVLVQLTMIGVYDV